MARQTNNMYQPSIREVRKLTGQGNLVPIYREINADLETPVSAYLKVAQKPYSFLLESVEGGERVARYSFIGTEPYSILKTGQGQPDGIVDPLVAVQHEMDRYQLVPTPGLPRFLGGAVGYLSYDVVHYFEPRVPQATSNPIDVPESIFMFTDTFLVFDHLQHTIKVVSHVHLENGVEKGYQKAIDRIDTLVERLNKPIDPTKEVNAGTGHKSNSPISSNFTQERYHQMVKRIKQYVHAGDVIQVVPSQRLSRPTAAQPLHIYRALRTINPSPYMYYMDLGGFQIIGASPEMLVQVDGSQVSTHPIAGTRPRGQSPQEEQCLEAELKSSEKQRAEHIMLVDLGRNDIGRVSEPGTVKVTQLMEVEKYSHVMHLVSHVVGQLTSGLTSYDAIRACFPSGTVSGAPKIRAMEIISELENEKRGPYTGAVGYFSFSGNMDTAIAIRTMVLKEGVAYVQAGGGIVIDSDPEDEYQETLQKASALLRAIDIAEGEEE